ncbi:MAG: efflux RND transporter periplasmic adaptor subunit [Nitrospiraceae bacterium]|nr:efflux RND transporter periplasmic adaptor subunit [Nitrospiraceae bacterium]
MKPDRIKVFSKVSLFVSFPIVSVICSAVILTGCKKEQKTAPPPPLVEVVDVIQKDVPIFSEYVGTADGLVNATIRAQVQGYLIKQNYKEGDLVRKGQILFEIDPRTFEAALEQAKGQLAAQQARWDTAKANLKRVRPLAEENAVSQKDLDDATGTEQAAHAAVIAAQAGVDKAKLDLGFTKVTSLIDGIAGIAKAQIGNLVGPGAVEELTTVSTVNPLKVYAQISEQEYLRFTENAQKSTQRRPLELILSDGKVYPHKGEFAFADRQVDVRTGTIRVAALFPNPGNILRPGQFAKVRAVTDMKKGAMLVPQRAVTEMQGKYLVAVIGPDNKIGISPVKVGDQVGSDWIIDKGLKPGDKVVAEGIQKVKDGLTVNPKPFIVEAGKKLEVQPKPEAPQKPGKR